MKREVCLALDAEYLAMLADEAAEAREIEAERRQEQRAFEAHYENDRESREEMERDEARYGSFEELIRANA